jgi:SAM-dependent methyltransferase
VRPDPHYTEPRLAALYDLECGWSEDRDFYLGLAGPAPQRVLDLGCGTGLMAAAYAARGHRVTGVDPAPAMLAVARARPGGADVEWVAATVQGYRSERRFDLVIMTGHAFQVLLDDADVAAALATMRRQLAPDGMAVFESRNPAIDWPGRWDGGHAVETPEGPVRVTRTCGPWEGEFLGFETRYAFGDGTTLVSPSRLRFLPEAAIVERVTAAGLVVERLLGDWRGTGFDAAGSEEMVFVVRRA